MRCPDEIVKEAYVPWLRTVGGALGAGSGMALLNSASQNKRIQSGKQKKFNPLSTFGAFLGGGLGAGVIGSLLGAGTTFALTKRLDPNISTAVTGIGGAIGGFGGGLIGRKTIGNQGTT